MSGARWSSDPPHSKLTEFAFSFNLRRSWRCLQTQATSMQDSLPCEGSHPDRTCDEDILALFGFTVCVARPFDKTNLPWLFIGMTVVTLLAAYTVAIVCIMSNLDRRCGSAAPAPAAPCPQVQTVGRNGADDVIRCNVTAGECGPGGKWYCDVFPDSPLCSSSPTPEKEDDEDSITLTTTPATTPTQTPTPSLGRCRCPRYHLSVNSSAVKTGGTTATSASKSPVKLRFRVEKEQGNIHNDADIQNEIVLDDETEIKLEMEGHQVIKTDAVKYQGITVSIEED